MKKFKLKATEKHTTFLIPKGLTYEKLRDKGFTSTISTFAVRDETE